jgi:hypothetical protein
LLEGSESLYIIDGSSYENQDNNAHKLGRPSGSLRQERHGVLSFVHLHKRFFAGFYGTNIFYRLLIFFTHDPLGLKGTGTDSQYSVYADVATVYFIFFDKRVYVIFWSTERIRHFLINGTSFSSSSSSARFEDTRQYEYGGVFSASRARTKNAAASLIHHSDVWLPNVN